MHRLSIKVSMMGRASFKTFLPQIYVAGMMASAELDLHGHEPHLSGNTEITTGIQQSHMYQILMVIAFFARAKVFTERNLVCVGGPGEGRQNIYINKNIIFKIRKIHILQRKE